MDPLSLAASVAGLISLADVVFRYVYKYGKTAAGAKQEVLALSQEINNLSSLLRTLEALASDLEDGGDAFNPALRSHLLGNCKDTLEKIRDKLKKATDNFQARSKLSGVTRQLKWPFAASETKELMAEISRYKETMTLAISSDSMRQLQLFFTKQDEHGKQISAVHTITKRIEINTRILVNNEKRRVLDFFMPSAINPQSSLEHNIRLRHPVTGMWLVESDDLTKWKQTPGSKLWLSGIPGGGKTVLAAAVIREALLSGSPQNGVAFFFCDYKNDDTWKPLSVLGAIASQLARQQDEAFGMLKAYFDTLHPERGLEKGADLEELRLIVKNMAELFDQVTVIIDGLDECGDHTDDVVDSIAETAENSQKLTVALFSRDEINIKLRLEDEFKHIPIAATTGDIDLFVGAEIQQRVQSGRFGTLSTALKDEIRERLVEGANGMFRWVVCQLDYLGEFATDADRRDALHELPPTLHGSYMRLLKRLARLPERIQSRVQMCLQFIASSNHLLSTIGTLRQAVSDFASTGPPLVETNLVSEREIEYRCSSLIRKSKDGNSFEFAHFSVKEFLESPSISEDPKFAGYHISKHRYQQLLASRCLKLVHLSNVYEQQHGTPPDFSIEDHKHSSFYEYACLNWPYVVREGLEDPSLMQLCHSLVSSTSMQMINSTTSMPPNLPASWKMLFRQAFFKYLRPRYSSGHRYKAIRDRLISEGKPGQWFEPIHLAAALNMPEVCLSLLKNGANPNHRCPYGTPLDLAMRAFLAFMPWESVWDEDEPEQTGWGRPEKHRELIYFMVPTASQRNRTIEILIQAGSELSQDRNPALDLGKETIFSTVSVIACHTKDFNPVIRLMSLGITPSDSELDALEGYFEYWNFEKGMHGDSQVRDRSLFDLLVYLDSTGAYDSAWGIRMGSIVWSTACAIGSAFTKERNLGIIDTRISLSKDGLVQQAQAAIRRDDSKALKTCLDDNRLDPSQVYTDNANMNSTMVELAVWANAVGCLEVLLDFGSNAGIDHTSAPSTRTLIHLCIREKALGSLRILVEHGASLLTVDFRGLTTYHECADQFEKLNVNFFRDVLELDPHATVAGLVMRMPNGKTPLDLLLLEHKNHKEIEQMTLLLMDWCDKNPRFWSENHQLFTHAAAVGSAAIIHRLLDMGAKPELLEPSNFLPLHNMNANATFECVGLLKSLYGEAACALRAGPDMQLPVELYILRCLEDAVHPNEAICHALLTPEVITPKDSTMGTLWGFCCETIPFQALKWKKQAKSAYLGEDERQSAQLLLMLLRLGCMDGYEESCFQSALIPLFKGILDGLESDWFRYPTFRISPNEPGGIALLAFDSTKHWDTAKTSPTTIRLLKQAMVDGHGELVSVLLRRGVDVHQRQDGVSAVEFLCLEFKVMTHHATAEGRGMISEVLDHANLESLNEVESNNGGLGLLHMITSCAEPGPAWLMAELVKRGVDIERKCATTRPMTPLLHHLWRKSFDDAQLLVELGASYGNRMQTDGRMDVPQTAAYGGGHTFLQFLLAHSVKNSIEIVWDRPCEVPFQVDKDEDGHGDVTALHFAAEGGSVDCLQLFYDKGLLKEFEPRTSLGWTPLHCAASNNSSEAIEFLVSKGAGVNTLADDKSSPLHIAVRCGHLDSVKTLVRLGAMSSRDSWAMTPKAYAVRYSNGDMIVCLDEAFGFESEVMPSTVPWRGMKHVFQSLESAIKRDDLGECRRLRDLGCPLDTSMPTCHGCSPLVYSLVFRSTEVARWMLENGASTLKLECRDCHTWQNYATEIATEAEELTTVLPKILERHHAEGADLVFGDEYPLHHAVHNDNMAAAEVILQHINDKKFDMGRRAQLDPHLVKSTIINRIGRVEDKDATPLHLAVGNSDLDMISLLVKNGARLDALVDNIEAPLSCASSESVAMRLIELGASLGPLYENNTFFPKLFHRQATSHDTTSLLEEPIFSGFYGRYSWIYASATSIQMDAALMLASRGHDLTQEHGVGRSLMHKFICGDTSSNLVLHNRDLGLDKTTPFPWHLLPRLPFVIAFLVSRFRHFRRLLSTDDFARIMNMQSDRGISPLCWAARMNRLDMMNHCLEMGADIDFEGTPFGSALMVACSYGQLDSVKFLVRRGAQTSYIGQNGPVNVMKRTQSAIVRQWLLVGRFNEQKRITSTEYETAANRNDCVLRPWSGIREARLKLTGRREMMPHESSFDYAKKLATIRRDMRGKIVPDLIGVGEA